MNDEEIIANKEYEFAILKNKKCISCDDDFKYKIHGNKQKLKKRELSYYTLYNDVFHNDTNFYSHENCLDDAFHKYISNDDKFMINGLEIKNIIYCDRYGNQLTKVNYTKNISKWIKQKLNKEFIKHILHMYDRKDQRRGIWKFQDKYLNDFNNAKANFTYKGHHVVGDPAPGAYELYDLMQYNY